MVLGFWSVADYMGDVVVPDGSGRETGKRVTWTRQTYLNQLFGVYLRDEPDCDHTQATS